LAAHDPNAVEVFCYSDVQHPDAVTERIKGTVPHWRQTSKMLNPEFAKAVLDDHIDVLIELTGHTGNNRLSALATRLAPVQMSWLGYPCTTGMAAIDYRITEAVADPVGTAD